MMTLLWYETFQNRFKVQNKKSQAPLKSMSETITSLAVLFLVFQLQPYILTIDLERVIEFKAFKKGLS